MDVIGRVVEVYSDMQDARQQEVSSCAPDVIVCLENKADDLSPYYRQQEQEEERSLTVYLTPPSTPPPPSYHHPKVSF